MKAIMKGSLAMGFVVSAIVADEAAEDIVVAALANGVLCEALTIDSPRDLDKRAPKPAPKGEIVVSYGKGLGNGFALYGPFRYPEVAAEFAEENRDEDEEWEVLTVTPEGV